MLLHAVSRSHCHVLPVSPMLFLLWQVCWEKGLISVGCQQQPVCHLLFHQSYLTAFSSKTSPGLIFSSSSGQRSKMRRNASFTFCHLLIFVLPQKDMRALKALFIDPSCDKWSGDNNVFVPMTNRCNVWFPWGEVWIVVNMWQKVFIQSILPGMFVSCWREECSKRWRGHFICLTSSYLLC